MRFNLSAQMRRMDKFPLMGWWDTLHTIAGAKRVVGCMQHYQNSQTGWDWNTMAVVVLLSWRTELDLLHPDCVNFDKSLDDPTINNICWCDVRRVRSHSSYECKKRSALGLITVFTRRSTSICGLTIHMHGYSMHIRDIPVQPEYL